MSAYLAAMYGRDAPDDAETKLAWVAADVAAGVATGLYASMEQFEAVTGHPWPWLLRAWNKGVGVELTAKQVAELVRDYHAVIEKNNELLRGGSP